MDRKRVYRHCNILATGSYLPERRVTNDELRRQLAHAPDYVDKMEASTGIRARHYVPEDWSTSDLALQAARRALARANRRPEDLDLIIVGTDSPDFITPATSVVLQGKLRAHRAGTFDVGCACASFPTALSAAAGLIAANASLHTILVVGVYLMHRLADPTDPSTFFYGDGAGAALVEACEKPGFLAAAFRADGTYHKRWGIFAGGTVEPASIEAVQAGRTRVRLLQRYPPEINEQGWPLITRDLAKNGNFQLDEVDLYLFTQVRKSTIEKVMGILEQPVTKTHTIMEEWGYTGSACLGMALDDAISKGKLSSGQLLVMVGSGVGYNQAAVAFRLNNINSHSSSTC